MKTEHFMVAGPNGGIQEVPNNRKIRRAYRAIARAYRLHIQAPSWAVALLIDKAGGR